MTEKKPGIRVYIANAPRAIIVSSDKGRRIESGFYNILTDSELSALKEQHAKELESMPNLGELAELVQKTREKHPGLQVLSLLLRKLQRHEKQLEEAEKRGFEAAREMHGDPLVANYSGQLTRKYADYEDYKKNGGGE